MYDYTIENSDVDRMGIEKIISSYNGEIRTIKSMSLADVQELITKQSNIEYYNSLRGKMVKSSSVRKEKYHDELFKAFRGGKSTTTSKEIDSGKVREMISKYGELKEVVKKTKEEAADIDTMFNELIEFFKTMPNYTYRNSDSKEIHHHKISTNGDKVDIEKDGSDEYDASYYKKLTGYYNFRFKQAKEVSSIYTKAYTMKVDAIKEALSTYRSVIRKGLNPFADKKKDGDK